MPQILSEVNDEAFKPDEVIPGSANDPFSVNYNPASVPNKGAERVVAEDGPKDTPSAEVTPSPTPEPPAPSLEDLLKDEKLQEYLAEKAREEAQKVARAQQSVYDKKIDALMRERDEARQAAIKAERESKLNSEDLTDDEKEILRNKYALEDERRELESYNDELNVYYRQLYVAQLSKEYAEFGVTPDALEQFDEPEEMDAFVMKAELDFYRTGKAPKAAEVTTQAPTRTVETTVPAGAQAPSDVGGSAPAARPREFSREASRDAMLHNLFLLPEESVPIRPN